MNAPLKLTRLKYRRTRVLVTLGPAVATVEVIKQLVEAGASVFRLNMSHGDADGHREAAARVRQVERQMGRPLALLADLCGPKIRVGRFAEGGIDLTRGQKITVSVSSEIGSSTRITTTFASLAADVEPGQRLLLADGLMQLKVDTIQGNDLECTVVDGGRLTDRKGINLPDTKISTPCLTEKDRADAELAAEIGVDLMALSFVSSAQDVFDLQMLLGELRCPARIVAKIERPAALASIDEILDVTDAIMVARGDLGVELEPESVPVAQRYLIDRARSRHVPVIVATQMLESMIENPRPTRAEVADVAHAVDMGADAVMLSAETAVGAYPLAAVEMMDRIAREAEAYLWTRSRFASLSLDPESEPPRPHGVAVGRASGLLSRDLMVRAIFVVSHNGFSAFEVCGSRPAAPIVVLTSSRTISRVCCLLWGVLPVLAEEEELLDPVAIARESARKLALAEEGHSILIVRGFHQDESRTRPSITVVTV